MAELDLRSQVCKPGSVMFSLLCESSSLTLVLVCSRRVQVHHHGNPNEHQNWALQALTQAEQRHKTTQEVLDLGHK